ncbi:MAG: hypothetical protein CMH57_07040 [Myxococcales bacterium]|nr:hypothetical protein [Myxococcales bacterium]
MKVDRVCDWERSKPLVLIAEDMESLRRVWARALRRAGYRVMEAADGQQAVEAVEQHGHEIAALILDVLMPIMSGPEAYALVEERCPGLPVLFVSGYVADSVLPGLSARIRFLKKPFKLSTLLSELEAIVAQRDAQVDVSETA